MTINELREKRNKAWNAVIMLSSHFYESRDGSTGGFFADNTGAAQQVWNTVNLLLRSDGGSNAKLANILEYGKHGQPAKPFLKPAKTASRQECIDAMTKALDEEVGKL